MNAEAAAAMSGFHLEGLVQGTSYSCLSAGSPRCCRAAGPQLTWISSLAYPAPRPGVGELYARGAASPTAQPGSGLESVRD